MRHSFFGHLAPALALSERAPLHKGERPGRSGAKSRRLLLDQRRLTYGTSPRCWSTAGPTWTSPSLWHSAAVQKRTSSCPSACPTTWRGARRPAAARTCVCIARKQVAAAPHAHSRRAYRNTTRDESSLARHVVLVTGTGAPLSPGPSMDGRRQARTQRVPPRRKNLSCRPRRVARLVLRRVMGDFFAARHICC